MSDQLLNGGIFQDDINIVLHIVYD